MKPKSPPTATPQTHATVMLMSTFHFANPAKDAVKHAVKDVMDEESQTYLEQLASRISQFQPTVVLLEYDPNEDRVINESYTKFRNQQHTLSSNEVEQLGFRIAKNCRLNRVHSFDERMITWKSQELFKQLKLEPNLEKLFQAKLNQLTKSERSNHSSLSLRELLKKYNSREMDDQNKSLYILTNAAGVDVNFAGADAAASWWHRNLRMLARIQKHTQPHARVLVIGGQGHIAVIRDLIAMDPNVVVEEISSYL